MSGARLTICMFDNERVRGGAEEHMLCLLRGLDRRRFRPLLVCPPKLLALLQPELSADIVVLPLALDSHRQFGLMWELSSFLRRERVDVLHSHGFRPSLLASPVGRWASVPVTCETPHVREYWRKGWKANYTVDRVASRLVDRYIAVSEANKKYLVDEKKLSARKVTVIRNGCDITRFAAVPAAGLKHRAGFAESDPVLVVAARLEPQKGHSVLLRAMAVLKAEFPSLRLVMLGDGSLREQLQNEARELGIESSILMPGHSPDVRQWMSVADVCVLPSFAEGLPLFAIECLAMQRPMVASAVDGTPEIVVDGETGLTVPPGDVVALVKAIAELLRNPARAAQLAANGAKWVRERFTLERQIRETEELYEELWQAKTGKLIPQKAEQQEPLVEAHGGTARTD
jgi:glycosyltransferase involved in cell wall biosynthesis